MKGFKEALEQAIEPSGGYSYSHVRCRGNVGIRHLQPYYAWHVLQVVLHFIDEQSSRHQFHQKLMCPGGNSIRCGGRVNDSFNYLSKDQIMEPTRATGLGTVPARPPIFLN